MEQFIRYITDMVSNPTVRKKLLYTIMILVIYRFLVFIPVPFADVGQILWWTLWSWTGTWLEYFAMLLWGTLENFAIIAVWLIPYINASIVMQLLTAVVPALEELQEQGEQWTQKIQQYTRWLTFPFAFLQSIWMVYFINFLLGWTVIPTDFGTILLSAFALSVWSILMLWLWELITEKWISNGISILIFASIIAGITSQVYQYISVSWSDLLWIIIFMLVIVLALIILSVLLIKTRKDIPVIYARQWQVQETASLPIPLNPVGMIPIIFAIAFASFPYLLSQIVINMWSQNQSMQSVAIRIEQNFNIYVENPWWLVIIFYFILIVLFTFFYAMITFNPDKIADTIQKRWWFIPWIRPWEETATYLNKVLMHLCFWWGMWLAFIGNYTYLLSKIPFVQQAAQSIGTIPVIVQGAWVIIIVWVVQELINKIDAELLMEKYDKI